LRWEQPAIRNHGGAHAHLYRHRYHLGEAPVEQRFAPEEADIANISFAQNDQSAIKKVSINPAQIADPNFSTGEVAEVAACIAGVSDGNITKRGATAADDPKHVPGF
jgi:hypothetical protein